MEAKSSYDQEKHPALGQSPREAWESGLDLGGPREHRRIRYDNVFRVLTLPGSPRETALVYRNHGIQFHYLLYWNDVFASPGIIGTKVKLRFDPFDISHIYVYVHNHWVECITSSFDRHIKVDVATAEHLVEKKRARGKTTTRYPDDPEMRDVYEEELRRLRLRAVLLDEAQHLITSGDGKQPKDQLNWIKSMAIETGVLHVLIGTYDLLPFCNLDGQMARRGSEFHFALYHIED